MPFVPALNTVRVAVKYISQWGEVANIVQHFRHAGGGVTSASVGDLFDVLDAWHTNNWSNVASTHWQTDLYTATDLTAAEGQQFSRVVTINGVNASPSMPAQNTVAVSTRTGLSGRSRRGRVFHVGMSEGMCEGSTINSGSANGIVAAYNALPGLLAPESWEWVVASFISGGFPRLSALLTPITHVILTDNIIDSMDSRKPSDL